MSLSYAQIGLCYSPYISCKIPPFFPPFSFCITLYENGRISNYILADFWQDTTILCDIRNPKKLFKLKLSEKYLKNMQFYFLEYLFALGCTCSLLWITAAALWFEIKWCTFWKTFFTAFLSYLFQGLYEFTYVKITVFFPFYQKSVRKYFTINLCLIKKTKETM